MSLELEVADLRSRVVRLEAQVEFLYQALNLVFAQNPNHIHPQIIELLKQGNKIEAIKTYREIYHVGLAEAKDAVEDIQSKFGL